MRIGTWRRLGREAKTASGDFQRWLGKGRQARELELFFFLSPNILLAGSWMQACRSGTAKSQWGCSHRCVKSTLGRHKKWGEADQWPFTVSWKSRQSGQFGLNREAHSRRDEGPCPLACLLCFHHCARSVWVEFWRVERVGASHCLSCVPVTA